jgi:hypothetical protein
MKASKHKIIRNYMKQIVQQGSLNSTTYREPAYKLQFTKTLYKHIYTYSNCLVCKCTREPDENMRIICQLSLFNNNDKLFLFKESVPCIRLHLVHSPFALKGSLHFNLVVFTSFSHLIFRSRSKIFRALTTWNQSIAIRKWMLSPTKKCSMTKCKTAMNQKYIPFPLLKLSPGVHKTSRSWTSAVWFSRHSQLLLLPLDPVLWLHSKVMPGIHLVFIRYTLVLIRS